MSNVNTLMGDLRVRLKTNQPIVWIRTDEPSRTAALVRSIAVEFITEREKRRLTNNQKVGPEGQNRLARSVFEHDVINGCWQITDGAAPITNPTKGTPVAWFNKDENGNQIAGTKPNNYNPNGPWRFFADISQRMPHGSVLVCHNLAEIVDMALRTNVPHGAALMRSYLLQLTSPLAVSSDVMPFQTSGRMLIATGRLPEAEIARPELLDTFDILTLDRPSEEELAEVVHTLLNGLSENERTKIIRSNTEALGTDDVQQQVRTAAQNLKGLAAFGAETAAARTAIECGHLSPTILSRQRRAMIELTPGIRFEEPTEEFAPERVKGLEKVMRFVARSFSGKIPDALIPNAFTLVGVPGGGKTMIAKAIAYYLKRPLLQVSLGEVFGPYIGTSQANMARLIAIADSVGRCVMLFDEVDKQTDGLISDGGNRGDSGVGSQVMGMLLSWQQARTSNSGGALIINTANRLQNLKSESQRAGRNDATFFVDFPYAGAREAILRQYLADYSLKLSDDEIARTVLLTKMWSGAELKELVRNYGRFGDIPSAFAFVRPVSKMTPEDIKRMRDAAKDSCIPAGDHSVNDDPDAPLINAASEALAGVPISRLNELLTAD